MAGSTLDRHCHSRSLDSNTSRPLSLAGSTQSVDASSDKDSIMSANLKEDVNDVLDDVIVKINRITDHLRSTGENEAANRFTQEMTNTLRELYNIIAPWDIEKCLMTCDTRSQPTTGALNGYERSDSSSKPRPVPSPGSTWAAIAATEPATDKSGIIKFRPGDSVQIKASQQGIYAQTTYDSRDQRVVWIRPWTATRPLKEVTKKIQNVGAVYSVAYAPEAEAVCIIFQHASCANELMRRCADHLKYNGISLFGAEHDIAPGLLYPMTKDLARMEMPQLERRRLTFARAGLFNQGGVTQKQFREDIEGIVGPSNVELLWLFNTGNATVVFSAVPLAHLVRNTFLQYGRAKGSSYSGIMVSYSHDPCERDMHLVSQIYGHPGYIGTGSLAGSSTRSRSGTVGSSGSNWAHARGGDSYPGASQKRRITGTNGSKASMDDDGWQTVKKRR